MAKQKINKKQTDDLFGGLKYVDNMLEESAGLTKEQPVLSFEEKLKKKLKEGNYEETVKEYGDEHPVSTKDAVDKMQVKKEAEGEVDEASELGFKSANLPEGMGLEEVDEIEEKLGSEKEIEELANEAEMKEYNYNSGTHNYNYDGSEQLFNEDPELEAIMFEDDEIPTDDATAMPAADSANAGAADEMPSDVDAIAADTTGAGEDMNTGMDVTPSAGGSIPTGDTTPGAEEPGAAPVADVNVDIISSPEDIDALIDQLVSEDGSESDMEEGLIEAAASEEEAVKKESTKVTKKNTKTMAEDTTKSTKLGDKTLTDKVKDEKANGLTKPGKAEKGAADLDFDKLDAETPTDKIGDEKGEKLSQPKFDAVKAKKESTLKSKAMYKLAEKVITLEDELAKLKFEHYKALKVNGILTLLPELKENTRIKLVTKFDECKSYLEVRKLYSDVSKMVKENKRPSINEAVTKNSKSVKTVITESAVNDEGQVDDTQARKNFLMGVKGYDDQYFNC